MPIVLMMHAVLRWFVVVAGAAGLVVAGVAWAGKRPAGSAERTLARVFAALLTVQGVVGFVLLIGGLVAGEGLSTGRLVHLGIMLIAIGLSHAIPNRAAADEAAGHRNRVAGIGGATLLTFLGVAALSFG